MLLPGTKKALKAQCDHALLTSKGADFPRYVRVDKEDQFKFAVDYIRDELYKYKALVSEDVYSLYTITGCSLPCHGRQIRGREEFGMTYYVCVLFVIPEDFGVVSKKETARLMGNFASLWCAEELLRPYITYAIQDTPARVVFNSVQEFNENLCALYASLKKRRYVVTNISQTGASITITFVTDSFEHKHTITIALEL